MYNLFLIVTPIKQNTPLPSWLMYTEVDDLSKQEHNFAVGWSLVLFTFSAEKMTWRAAYIAIPKSSDVADLWMVYGGDNM